MKFTRRRFLQSTLAASVTARAATNPGSGLRIAPFRYDVTAPVGHPMCGGWGKMAVDHVDSLEAIGYVLLGAGKPIVVCAVDWAGILNEAHLAWRTALAEAAGTTPDRVAVHCVHQHDAPMACLRAQELCDAQGENIRVFDRDFFNQCLDRGRAAIKAALPRARTVTHVAHGEGRVEKVASNRRVEIGPDGKVKRMRGSSCRVPELIALPEGLIDPMLKTVAFYSGAEKIVSCHYYATHPMSHYGAGHVSSDFPGLARKRRQQDEPGCTHIYFTGCAGNVAAGKYNPGGPEARVQLTQRIYDGILAAEKSLALAPVGRVAWQTHEILPEINPSFPEARQRAMVANKGNSLANRIRPAMCVALAERVARRVPVLLSALHLGDVTLLHLPAECFVEYQLRAQQIGGRRFVATAAYGDGGMWYVPVKEEYPKGGFEVGVAFCAPSVDDTLEQGIRALLRA